MNDLSLDSENPDEKLPISAATMKQTQEILLENWFVVGARLSLCSNITMLPNSIVDGVKELCIPQFRLVLQPFGVRREVDGVTGAGVVAGSSDDKAIHIIYDYIPSMTPSEKSARVNKISTIETAVFSKLGNTNGTSISEARALIKTSVSNLNLSSHKIAEAQKKLMSIASLFQTNAPFTMPENFVDLLDWQSKNSLADKLQYRKAFEEMLSQLNLGSTTPTRLTISISNSGRAARPGSKWIFANFNSVAAGNTSPGSTKESSLKRTALPSLVLQKIAPESAVNNDALLWAKQVNAGVWDTLGPIPGSLNSVDAELLKEAKNDLSVAKSFSTSVFMPFLDLVSDQVANSTLEAELDADPNPSKDSNKRLSLRAAVNDMFSPHLQSAGSASCSGCHVAAGARDRYLVEGTPRAAPKNYRKNESKVAAGQARFNEMWNLRMFGYFERDPSIADRVILEVKEDAKFANATHDSKKVSIKQ